MPTIKIPELKAKKGEKILLIKEGENASKYHPKGHWFQFCRLNRNRPASTFAKQLYHGGSNCIHYSEDRNITISELKRLCSFPDNFIFNCSFVQAWACIGDAVMPRFMRALAEHIKVTVFNR